MSGRLYRPIGLLVELLTRTACWFNEVENIKCPYLNTFSENEEDFRIEVSARNGRQNKAGFAYAFIKRAEQSDGCMETLIRIQNA
jgi:hypothetical protein